MIEQKIAIQSFQRNSHPASHTQSIVFYWLDEVNRSIVSSLFCKTDCANGLIAAYLTETFWLMTPIKNEKKKKKKIRINCPWAKYPKKPSIV